MEPNRFISASGIEVVVHEPWPDQGSPFALQLFFADVSPGRRECVGLYIGSFEVEEGQGIAIPELALPVGDALAGVSTSLLRRVRLKELVGAERARRRRPQRHELTTEEWEMVFRAWLEEHPGETRVAAKELLESLPPELAEAVRERRKRPATERRLGKGGRPRYSPEHFEEVAREYRELVEAGETGPARVLAGRYGRSIRTVRNWIVECGKRGLLPKHSSPGRVRAFPKEDS